MMRTGFSTRLTAPPLPPIVAAAVPAHSTATTDTAWDAATNVARLPSPLTVAAARAVYAWYDAGEVTAGELPKAACKFPHHMVSADGQPGAANTHACSAGIGVLNGARQGANIPAADRQGIYNHLVKHLRDAGVGPADVPELKAAADDPIVAGVAVMEQPWSAVLAIEGVPTSDGRLLKPGSVTWRTPPMPLMLQTVTAPGHDDAQIAGRIDEVHRVGNLVVGSGVLLADESGARAAQLIDGKFLDGTSFDGVDWTSQLAELADGRYQEQIDSVTMAAATVTPVPAFADCKIVLGGQYPLPSGMVPVLASAMPAAPPAAWFDDPGLVRPTPLTITAAGEVFGHLAQFGVCHRAVGNDCLLVPRNHSGYSQFRTGSTLCDDGTIIRTGVLTMGGGHAAPDPRLSVTAVRAHYDGSPGTVAMASVASGEDAHGVWVHGWILPGRTTDQIVEFRAKALSGDWRAIRGAYELIGALAVPVPAWPIAASVGDPPEPATLPIAALQDGEPAVLLSAGIVWPGGCACGCTDELDAIVASVGGIRRGVELDELRSHVAVLVGGA